MLQVHPHVRSSDHNCSNVDRDCILRVWSAQSARRYSLSGAIRLTNHVHQSSSQNRVDVARNVDSIRSHPYGDRPMRIIETIECVEQPNIATSIASRSITNSNRIANPFVSRVSNADSRNLRETIYDGFFLVAAFILRTLEITQSPRMSLHCHCTRSATCVHFIVLSLFVGAA